MDNLIEYFVNWNEYSPEKKRRIITACLGVVIISFLSFLFKDEIIGKIKGEKREISSTDVAKLNSRDIGRIPEINKPIEEEIKSTYEPKIESKPINDDVDESKCFITIVNHASLQIAPAHMLNEGVIKSNIPPKRYQVLIKKIFQGSPSKPVFYKIRLDDGTVGWVRGSFVEASPKCFQ